MPQTIIIAAHDPNIAYLLQRYAEESGFQTVNAGQCNDVFALAQHTRPALIILDSELPGMVGGKVVQRLKAEPATRHIPVVVYSGLDEESPVQDGVASYLQKSVMYDDFLAALKCARVQP